jgi:hypothetical protein
MLSVRLVRIIEDHAEELTRALIKELQSNSRTAAYHRLSHADLQDRLYDVYRNLGHWLGHETDKDVEATYSVLGKKRAAEGIPLSEVVYALILCKYHLRDYIRSAGLVDSAVELYQEQELHRLVGHFFDRAIYNTVKGYEREAVQLHASRAAKPAR